MYTIAERKSATKKAAWSDVLSWSPGSSSPSPRLSLANNHGRAGQGPVDDDGDVIMDLEPMECNRTGESDAGGDQGPPRNRTIVALAAEWQPRTIALIGCGVLGSALLTGFLRHIRAAQSNAPEKHLHFIVTTCTAESQTRLNKKFMQDADRIDFVSGGGQANVVAMQSADIVFLAFPSSLASTILSNEYDLAGDLSNKLVISLLRDVSTTEIDILIDPRWPNSKTPGGCPPPIIVGAAPYPGEGLRIVGRSNLLFIPKDASNTLRWLFAMVGKLNDKEES